MNLEEWNKSMLALNIFETVLDAVGVIKIGSRRNYNPDKFCQILSHISDMPIDENTRDIAIFILRKSALPMKLSDFHKMCLEYIHTKLGTEPNKDELILNK